MADLPIPHEPISLQPFKDLPGEDVELTPELVQLLLKRLDELKTDPNIDDAERKLRAHVIAQIHLDLMHRLAQQEQRKKNGGPLSGSVVSAPPRKEATSKTATGDIIDVGGDAGVANNIGNGTTKIKGGVTGRDRIESQINNPTGPIFVLGDKSYHDLIKEQKNASGLSEAAQAYLAWLAEAARRVPLGKLDLAM